jgi:hypothetical protein
MAPLFFCVFSAFAALPQQGKPFSAARAAIIYAAE